MIAVWESKEESRLGCPALRFVGAAMDVANIIDITFRLSELQRHSRFWPIRVMRRGYLWPPLPQKHVLSVGPLFIGAHWRPTVAHEMKWELRNPGWRFLWEAYKECRRFVRCGG
jgi:hypothetical protein